MKKIFIVVAVLAMTVCFLIYPENCLKSAKYGLDLWFAVVLPSLLPFMVASLILLETGFVRLISHVFSPVTRFLFGAPGESAYVFFAAAFSGYPLGARLTGELYAKKQICEADAQRIVRFTSVSGPVFITGAVATGMLGLAEAGAQLAAAHYLSALLTGVIFGLFSRSKTIQKNAERLPDAWRRFREDIAQCRPLGELLSSSVEKALATLLKIGGFIVFFSVVMEVLTLSGLMDAAVRGYAPVAGLGGLSPQATRAMIAGGIEMTNGCAIAAALPVDTLQKLSVISSIIAFGGLSIHMQTKSVCADAGFAPKHFLLAKSLQALLAFGLSMLFFNLFPLPATAFSQNAHIKTAAFGGVVFAGISLLTVLIIRHIQIRKSFLVISRKL